MPRSSFALTALPGLLLVLGGCDSETAPAAQPEADAAAPAGEGELTGTLDRAKAGEALPEFTMAKLAGGDAPMDSLAGTPTLINLWATWCAPCVLEMPMLNTLAANNKGKLRVVAISQDMKGAEEVEPFLAERDLPELEVWLDTKNDLAFHYGGGGTVLPLTILYDASGKEVWRMVGGYDWSTPEAQALVAEALPAG